MTKQRTIPVVGVATDIAGNHPGTALAPGYLKQHAFDSAAFDYHTILTLNESLAQQPNINQVADICTRLATATHELALQQQPFFVVCGDHSIAIGTWSGVSHALQDHHEPFALIWIDAHLDAHTFEDSHTKNIHGMPAACLVGEGDEALTHILNPNPKIDPRHLFTLGFRSFHADELNRLQRLGAHCYSMNHIQEHSLETILNDITQKLDHLGIKKIGITLDVDALDPTIVPAVTVPEANGLSLEQTNAIINHCLSNRDLLAFELVELAPNHDRTHKSLHAVQSIINTVQSNLTGP